MGRYRKTLAVLGILFIGVLPLGAWTLFENFESHKWHNPYWSDGWDRQMQPVWGNFQGRACLKLTGPTNGPAHELSYEPLITDTFINEIWTNVSLVKLDVYTESSATDLKVRIEPHAVDGSLCVASAANQTMSTSTWTTYTWDYSVTSPVAKLYLIFDSLGANAATFYVDNLRLVLNDGTTHYWDDFDDAGRSWSVAGSTALWSATPDFVTHNVSTATVNAGAGVLWWNYTGPATAELQTGVSSVNWSAYNMIRADVRCSTTSIPVRCYVWYDTWGEETAPRYVTQKDTWQTLYWQLPAGTTTHNVQGFNLRLDTSNLTPSGTCYIDNISLGNVAVSVVKSTSTAQARSGDSITYTITYGNAGTDSASNLLISDVIPFNSYISQAATAGSADSIEYFVGSSWTSTYNSSATKIRWRDNDVAAGASDLSVSYIATVK